MVAVSPQLPEHSAKIARRHKLAFDVLSDRGNQVARSYGLVYTVPDDLREVYLSLGVDLPKFNGDDSWTLAMPGRFIIGRDGEIKHAEASPDYTVRPEPSLILEQLQQLAR